MLAFLVRILLFSSWATLYFMPRKSIKQFLPVTTLSSLITMTIVSFGTHYNFWRAKGGTKNKLYNLSSICLGSYPVATMWIFKLTYGKFGIYLLTNLAINLIYTFPIITFYDKVKFIKYFKFTRIHHLIVAMAISLILYGYQFFIDKTDTSKPAETAAGSSIS